MARFTITIYEDDPNGMPGVDYGEEVLKVTSDSSTDILEMFKVLSKQYEGYLYTFYDNGRHILINGDTLSPSDFDEVSEAISIIRKFDDMIDATYRFEGRVHYGK